MKTVNHFRCKKCNEYNKVEMDIDLEGLPKKLCGISGCEKIATKVLEINPFFVVVCKTCFEKFCTFKMSCIPMSKQGTIPERIKYEDYGA